jgi:hypothetical protein
VQDAVFALERLPGYRYEVVDPWFAPGLVLVGTVASPERREWLLHEAGFEDRVVARWRLVGNDAYADVSGRWERIERVPFDADGPLDFAIGDVDLPFEPIGELVDAQVSDTYLDRRRATLYYINRELGAAAYDPESAGRAAADSLTVAKTGGYLLAYSGPSDFRAADSETRTIRVTPLAKAPLILSPSEGARVFEGQPPPWRAFLIGLTALNSLGSYRFVHARQTVGPEIRVEGRVSDQRGRVDGRVPDPYAEGVEVQTISHGVGDMVNLDLIYIGRKVWLRAEQGRWERSATNILTGQEPDEAALELLSYVPSGPSDMVVGSGEAFGSYYYPSVFGISGLYETTILTGGESLKTETINGVRAFHYRGGANGDHRGIVPTELWLAEDGHYVVRSHTDYGRPPDAPPGEREASGVDVFDANEPVEVEPPGR